MRGVLFSCLCLACWPLWAEDAASPAAMKLRFATQAEAAQLLATTDEFISRLSPFDRSVRLKSDQPVAEEQFLKFVSQQALDWNADEKETLQASWDRVVAGLAEARFKAPAEVTLIKTTGLEEGDAAYTRGTAIILPRSKTGDRKPDALMAHELFHVLSRYDAQLRDRLYELIGFQRCGELQLPDDLQARRLTNPDAPVNEHCIQVTYQGEQRWVVPILFSKADKYDKQRGGGLFNYLQFALMAIESPDKAMPTKPLLVDGKPLTLEVRQAEGYMEKIGKNTGYIIHADEVLADNFSMMITKKSVAQPELLSKIEKSLKMQ